MKLSKSMTFYSAIGIGIVGFLASPANANQISAHKQQNNHYISPLEPKIPKKENYLDKSTMKAILQKEEKISEDIEIKHRIKQIKCFQD